MNFQWNDDAMDFRSIENSIRSSEIICQIDLKTIFNRPQVNLLRVYENLMVAADVFKINIRSRRSNIGNSWRGSLAIDVNETLTDHSK